MENGSTISDLADRTSYAQAALTIFKGDPAIRSQYQNSQPAIYNELQQNAKFDPSNVQDSVTSLNLSSIAQKLDAAGNGMNVPTLSQTDRNNLFNAIVQGTFAQGGGHPAEIAKLAGSLAGGADVAGLLTADSLASVMVRTQIPSFESGSQQE